MGKREVVGSMSDWAGVLKDFFRQIGDGSKTFKQVVAFNEGEIHLNLVSPLGFPKF